MKTGRSIALATLCAVIPLAQARANSNASNKAHENAKVRRIVFQYAACVVKRHHKSAVDAILADVGNDEIRKHYPELISSNCMSGVAGGSGVRFGGDLYRYALADALVNADFATEGPVDFSDRLPLAHVHEFSEAEQSSMLKKATGKKAKTKIQDGINMQNGVAVLSRYGECVVRHDPADARLWILTAPEVPEETSRINALKPAFSACLENGTAAFNKATMRGLVALNYYRLANATPQPGLGKAH